jgi:hypothetical protein
MAIPEGLVSDLCMRYRHPEDRHLPFIYYSVYKSTVLIMCATSFKFSNSVLIYSAFGDFDS